MKIVNNLLAGVMLAVSIHAWDEKRTPTAQEMAQYHHFDGNWTKMRETLEKDSYLVQGSDMVHTQEPWSFVLSIWSEEIFFYNLDVEGCKTEIPAKKIIRYKDLVLVRTQFNELIGQNPCFRNGDKVAIGSTVKTVEGLSVPLLSKFVHQISLNATTTGYKLAYIRTFNDDPEPTDGYFWYIYDNYETENFILDKECPLPSKATLQTFQNVSLDVSGIGTKIVDWGLQAQGLQVKVVPSRPGCSVESPLNIYGDSNNIPTLNFPDCYGRAYVTHIIHDGMEHFSCGETLPYQINLNPKADHTHVFFRNDGSGYEFDHDECDPKPRSKDAPIYKVKSVIFFRDTSDIGNTKMTFGIFNPEDNTKGSSFMTYLAGAPAGSKIEQPLDVLSTDIVHDLTFRVSGCKFAEYNINARIQHDPLSDKKLIIHFPSNKLETDLDHYVELVGDETPVPSKSLRI